MELQQNGRVLKALLEHQHEYLSGKELSGRLGVTRAAVWKEIERLRREGYGIASATNRGYRLEQVPNILSEPLIRHWLGDAATEPMVVLPQVDSTNLYAQRLALSGTPSGTVVLAQSQTSGAGRLGRSFFSPPGVGIYLSFVLWLHCPSDRLGLLTSFAGLAVRRAVAECAGVWTQIKWPNDLLLGSKKLCGILTRTQADGESGEVSHAVIGIGINVLQTPEEFPEELRNKATSLRIETGQAVNLSRLAAEVILQLKKILMEQDWLSNPQPSQLRELREASCTLGRQVLLTTRDGEQQAFAKDIAEDGSLVVTLPDGSEFQVASGEVSVRGLLGYQ